MKTNTGGNWVKLLKGTKIVMAFADEDKGIIENKVVVLEEDWAAQLGSGKCDLTITGIVESVNPL